MAIAGNLTPGDIVTITTQLGITHHDSYVNQAWKPLNPKLALKYQISNGDILEIRGRMRGGATGVHIPETAATNLTNPWEGLLITNHNTIVHLYKHSSKEVLLNAIAELNLTPDNFITIYRSAYLNG